MLEWPAYCALSLLLNKVIFNFAKDVGMYACFWHAYFVILMGLILYGKKLCYCLI
jgi:diacylglycerol kinase